MRTTIDRAGRIVVPKALRDALGLTGGQDLELTARDGVLEVRVAATPMKLERRGGHAIAVADVDLPPLTSDLVREVLEQSRR
jgi:AbrB family looped-hinge helix DNA binding protein